MATIVGTMFADARMYIMKPVLGSLRPMLNSTEPSSESNIPQVVSLQSTSGKKTTYCFTDLDLTSKLHASFGVGNVGNGLVFLPKPLD
jgi:hypothetical protein